MGEGRYVLGDWNAICDRCGFQFKASELKLDWRGQRLCNKDWEPRHPQDFVRGRPERVNPDWVRPDESDALIPYTTNKLLPAGADGLYYFDTTAGKLYAGLPAANTGVRTNYLINNTAFAAAGWLDNEIVVSSDGSSVQSPDGTTTTDLLIPSAVNTSQHFVSQATQALPVAGTQSVYSIHASANGYNFLIAQLQDGGGNGYQACFNLATGVVVVGATTLALGTGTFRGATMRPMGDLLNTYQCCVTGIVPTSFTPTLLNYVSVDAGNNPYPGGVGSILAWGAQFELGNTPSQTIVTAGAAVARATADTHKTGVSYRYNVVNYAGSNNVVVSSPSQIIGSTTITPGTTAIFEADVANNIWRRL